MERAKKKKKTKERTEKRKDPSAAFPPIVAVMDGNLLRLSQFLDPIFELIYRQQQLSQKAWQWVQHQLCFHDSLSQNESSISKIYLSFCDLQVLNRVKHFSWNSRQISSSETREEDTEHFAINLHFFVVWCQEWLVIYFWHSAPSWPASGPWMQWPSDTRQIKTPQPLCVWTARGRQRGCRGERKTWFWSGGETSVL